MQNIEDKTAVISGVADSISTLRRYMGLQKVEPIVEMVKAAFKAKAYEKLVIFAIHRDVIENLRVGLRELKPVVLYGGTDPEKRQRNIDRFQNNPACKVFIGNIQAAGTAITLTAAHNVWFVEQDWVPGNNAQAVMRCHRIGQENPVTVRFISLDQSLDHAVMLILKRKVRDLTQIFD
jgi:SWI/SNF-related matrix-associated actin-dependent regulator 1 of chromatin subfamily A